MSTAAGAPAIEVSNLGKRYRLGVREEARDTLVAALGTWVHSPLASYRRLRDLTRFADGTDTADTIWALRDASFELKEGEALGIIGRNGAGKSTLLKILSRITPPSTGRAVLRGRVASLLEVGTGFHPELSGRENIYLNGTLLGMSRQEIDRKLEEIVEFAGVGRFLDTPIKRYSSGMQVRLAFSVAAHLDAEVLVVDEVLAVGDLEFQRKCLGRMGNLARSGRTVLFVSHNMGVVKTLCSRGIVLTAGQVTFDGSAGDAVQKYIAAAPAPPSDGNLPADSIRYATGLARITTARVTPAQGPTVWYGEGIPLELEIVASAPFPDLMVDVKVHAADGTVVAYATSTLDGGAPRRLEPGTSRLRAVLDNSLHPGDYTLSVGLHHSTGVTVFLAEEVAPFTVEKAGTGPHGGYPYSWSYGYVRLESQWASDLSRPVAPRTSAIRG